MSIEGEGRHKKKGDGDAFAGVLFQEYSCIIVNRSRYLFSEMFVHGVYMMPYAAMDTNIILLFETPSNATLNARDTTTLCNIQFTPPHAP